ncbi:MAG: formylmethanofuran dehydrogenase [Chloroflexi bacterium]|nr:formylmethanofuran dehydrogenase [Chloroflexota bacterium]
MSNLQALLEASASRHSHLCPRQVLGVRIGLAGAAALGLETHRRDKRLLVILETDGCFADGVGVATGCTVGRRTLRVEDYGKIAATFVDVKTGRAVRVAPRLDVRQRARAYAPEERRRYFAQLKAYQIMPDDELLMVQEVELNPSIETIVSRPVIRTNCDRCGEEIINEREVRADGQILCRSCAGASYYRILSPWEEQVLAAFSGDGRGANGERGGKLGAMEPSANLVRI